MIRTAFGLTLLGSMMLVSGKVLSLWSGPRSSPTTSVAREGSNGIRIVTQAGVEKSRRVLILTELGEIRQSVDADFGMTSRPLLVVKVFATHAGFARALYDLDGVRPEGTGDTVGNVVNATLPLGPPNSFLRHNLAHVYTEWILDRLTHNSADRQPNPAWLYDGIAEWEADRYSDPLPCSLHGAYPLALTAIASEPQWWHTRAGLFGGLEYCEAKLAAQHLIHRVGFSAVRALLHSSGSWTRFVHALAKDCSRATPSWCMALAG